MTNRLAHKTLPFAQILLVMAVIVAIYLLVDFGRQVQMSYERREELEGLQQQIALAEEEQARLEKELEYAQSDEAVDEWARLNGLAKPGEVPIVVVAPPGDTSPKASESPEEMLDADAFREMWWNLFFGNR